MSAVRHTQTEVKFDLIIMASVAAAYNANRFWLREAVKQPMVSYILKCHFNDWLAGIGIIAYLNLLQSTNLTAAERVESIFHASFICLICGLLWEYAIPQFIRRGTSDCWDIAAYILGGIAYILIFYIYSECYALRKSREAND